VNATYRVRCLKRALRLAKRLQHPELQALLAELLANAAPKKGPAKYQILRHEIVAFTTLDGGLGDRFEEYAEEMASGPCRLGVERTQVVDARDFGLEELLPNDLDEK